MVIYRCSTNGTPIFSGKERKKLMNKKKLKSIMALTDCDNFKKLSQNTGINYRSLIGKINGERPLYREEIIKIVEVLHIDDSSVICDIFLR